jgi:hypothetical protein
VFTGTNFAVPKKPRFLLRLRNRGFAAQRPAGKAPAFVDTGEACGTKFGILLLYNLDKDVQKGYGFWKSVNEWQNE